MCEELEINTEQCEDDFNLTTDKKGLSTIKETQDWVSKTKLYGGKNNKTSPAIEIHKR